MPHLQPRLADGDANMYTWIEIECMCIVVGGGRVEIGNIELIQTKKLFSQMLKLRGTAPNNVFEPIHL